MSGQLGELVVSLQADIARFREDMGKATKIAQDNATSMSSAFASVQSAIVKVSSAMAVVTAGAGFKKLVEDAAGWNLEAAKMAKTMGISSEQASAMNVALRATGVGIDVAEAAALRLSKDLATGTDKFDKYGIAVKDSNGNLLTMPQIMANVNAKLLDTKTGTERNIMAMDLYGRSWKEIQSILKLTPAAMNEARQTAERLHLIVGKDGVAAAAEYKKNMRELSLVSSALATQLGNELLPAVVSIGSVLVNAGEHGVGAMATSVSTLSRVIKENTDTFAVFAAALAAPSVAAGIGAVATALGSVSVAVGSINAAMLANPVGLGALLGAGTYYATKQADKGIYNLTGLDISGMNRPLAQTEEAQRQLNANNNYLSKRLKDLGLSSWQQFEDYSKRGVIVFNQAAGKWEAAVKSTVGANSSTSAAGSAASAAAAAARAHADAVAKTIESLKFEQQQLERTNLEQRVYTALKRAGVSDGSASGQQIRATITASFVREKQIDEAKTQIKGFLDSVSDYVEQQVAAEDFTKGIAKKLSLLTPQPTGFTKTPALSLGGNYQFKSLEQQQAEIDMQARLDEDYRRRVQARSQAESLMDTIGAGNDPTKRQLAKLQSEHDEKIKMLEDFARQEIITEEEKNQAILEADQNLEEQRNTMRREQYENMAMSISGTMASLSNTLMQGNKKQFEAGKAFAIATATINTYMAASNAFRAASNQGGIVGVVLGVAAAAAAVAAGMMQVSQIASTQYSARALGGPVTAGETYLVGEKGPELMTAGASGFVTPNNQLSKLGGQHVEVTQVFQVSTGVAETTRAEIHRAAPYLTALSIEGVKRAMRNGEFQGIPV